MLVNKIMQVLKNLFGLNKKISASEIAIKDSNNNVYTLDDYLKMGSIYSTNEVVIGRWIDGKPLYQKVILYTGDISSTIDNQHSHGIENVDTIFVKFAFIQSTGNERLAYSLPVTQYGSNTVHDELSVVINRTKYQFLVQTGWGGSLWHAHIIVNYTKTTD